jgi:phosphoribosylanthranilate isomerase
VTRHALKVCRVETLLGAKLVASAGADLIGVHAIDRDRFSPQRAHLLARIAGYLRRDAPHCQPVLVTRSSDADFIAGVCHQTGISIVQLHASPMSPDMVRELEPQFSARKLAPPAIIKNVPQAAGDSHELKRWSSLAWGILVDKNDRGGTGSQVDWDLARRAFASVHHGRTWISGGLNPDNVLDALAQSGAWGADAQTGLEFRGPEGPRREMKDVTRIIAMAARVHGLDVRVAASRYRLRRSRPRILFSPTEMNVVQASALLSDLVATSIDGVQVDAADGSAGVPPWPVDPAEWGRLIWARIPEAPFWLHLFSRDVEWMAACVSRVQHENPHLIGVLVQDDRTAAYACASADSLAARLNLVVGVSLTVDQVEGSEVAFEQRDLWQITAPKRPEERASRVSRAIMRIKAAGAWVHLDRGITLSLVKDLTSSPDGITIGRAIDPHRLQDVLDEFEAARGRPGP